MLVGWVLAVFDRHSWLVVSSGFFPTTEVTLERTLWFLRALVLSPSLFVFPRMRNEDTMLAATFGDEWRAWVEKVPSRLIPGVY